jgi:hypothetical protein
MLFMEPLKKLELNESRDYNRLPEPNLERVGGSWKARSSHPSFKDR